jgi:hypothetical protein
MKGDAVCGYAIPTKQRIMLKKSEGEANARTGRQCQLTGNYAALEQLTMVIPRAFIWLAQGLGLGRALWQLWL